MPRFKQIPDYPDYMVSEDGQIYSLKKDKFLKPALVKGYPMVKLTKDGKPHTVYVHVAVATTFIPNPDPDNLLIINHKDENPLNSNVSNLEWCDRKYNLEYNGAKERMRAKHDVLHLGVSPKEDYAEYKRRYRAYYKSLEYGNKQ